MEKLRKVYVLPIGLFVLAVVVVGALIWHERDVREARAQDILKEIERLGTLPQTKYVYDGLEEKDLRNLNLLTVSDRHAAGFVEEAMWMIRHNETDHVGHSLYFLQEYEKTGEDSICIPHELTHIRLYVKDRDYELAEKQFQLVEKTKNTWVGEGEKKFAKFPPYYEQFKELLPLIDTAVERLQEKKYDNETIQLLGEIEEKEVC